MSDATVVDLAESVTALIQAAVDDPDKPLGANLAFDVKRVAFLEQWKIESDEDRIRIRVATLGTDGAPEKTRTTYGVNFVIPVIVIKRLLPAENYGESIDSDNSLVLAMCDKLSAVVQCITQIFAARTNWDHVSGVHFIKWTHQDKANSQGWIFNPEALKVRRQYESTILLHYGSQFSATS